MTKKEEALMNYVEFSLVGMITSLEPYFKEDLDKDQIYEIAFDVLEDIQNTVEQSSDLSPNTH